MATPRNGFASKRKNETQYTQRADHLARPLIGRLLECYLVAVTNAAAVAHMSMRPVTMGMIATHLSLNLTVTVRLYMRLLVNALLCDLLMFVVIGGTRDDAKQGKTRNNFYNVLICTRRCSGHCAKAKGQAQKGGDKLACHGVSFV